MPNYPWKSGDHLAICDFCGFKRLRSEMRMTWENWLVCRSTCWEPRHPQDITPPSYVDRQWVAEPRDRRFINNFSGWFIQDATVSITKTGDEFNALFAVDGSWGSANQVYTYADYGVDYFDGDFEFRTILRLDTAVFNTRNFFGVTDGIAGWDDLDTIGALGFTAYVTPGDVAVLQVQEGNNGNEWTAQITDLPPIVNTEIGLVFRRNGNNIEVTVFADRFFTKPIKTQIYALQGLTNLKYRYLFACMSSIVFEGNQEFNLQYTAVELR